MGQAEFAKQQAQRPWRLRFSGVAGDITRKHEFTIFRIPSRHNAWRRWWLSATFWSAPSTGTVPYWLAMTIVLVLKPEFTTTFTRGVFADFRERLLGFSFLATAPISLCSGNDHSTDYFDICLHPPAAMGWPGELLRNLRSGRQRAYRFFLIALHGSIAEGIDLGAEESTPRREERWRFLAYWIWPTWGTDSSIRADCGNAG